MLRHEVSRLKPVTIIGKESEYGMDLVALNIQRGRDHGLPGYNAFREVCGYGRVTSFDRLTDLIPLKIVERLELLYDHVDDVDLFVGGISETAEKESMLGSRAQHKTVIFHNPIMLCRTNIQMHCGRSVCQTSVRRQARLV